MTQSIAAADVKTIIMACEAGMGSSLMVVNSIKKKLKKANVSGVNVVHKGLANVVRRKAPSAVVVTFSHFLNDPAFDRLVEAFVAGGDIQGSME